MPGPPGPPPSPIAGWATAMALTPVSVANVVPTMARRPIECAIPLLLTPDESIMQVFHDNFWRRALR